MAAILGGLRTTDDVVLAGALVPLLEAGVLDEARGTEIAGPAAMGIALELRRIGVLGVPGQWNPAQGLKPEQAEGLRKLLVALAADVRLVLVRLVLQLVRLRGAKSQSREEQVRAAVEAANRRLPDYARVADWLVAAEPFTPQNGALTTNGRNRREAIWNRYRRELDALYDRSLELTA